jgi:hypothetical protein
MVYFGSGDGVLYALRAVDGVLQVLSPSFFSIFQLLSRYVAVVFSYWRLHCRLFHPRQQWRSLCAIF